MNVYLKSINIDQIPKDKMRKATREELYGKNHQESGTIVPDLPSNMKLIKTDDPDFPRDSCTNDAYKYVNGLAQVQTGFLQTLQDSLDTYKEYSVKVATFIFPDGTKLELNPDLADTVQSKLNEVERNLKNMVANNTEITRVINSNLKCKYPDLAKSLEDYTDSKTYNFDLMNNFEENVTNAIETLKNHIVGISSVWSNYCQQHSKESLPRELSGTKARKEEYLYPFKFDTKV